VADALSLSFHAISVGSQTSKSDLAGYMTATGEYVRTQFREAYENGGLFLLDEADAGNSNVLILLNAALSNGKMAFPDGMVDAHPVRDGLQNDTLLCMMRLLPSMSSFLGGTARGRCG